MVSVLASVTNNDSLTKRPTHQAEVAFTDTSARHLARSSFIASKMMAWLMSDRAVSILVYSLQFASESPTQYFLSLEVWPTQKTVFFPAIDAHSAMER